MTRQDMITAEQDQARNYRREAKRRRTKNPALATMLDTWAQASEARVEAMRCGPLFGRSE
jgi:hypothetical protein